MQTDYTNRSSWLSIPSAIIVTLVIGLLSLSYYCFYHGVFLLVHRHRSVYIVLFYVLIKILILWDYTPQHWIYDILCICLFIQCIHKWHQVMRMALKSDSEWPAHWTWWGNSCTMILPAATCYQGGCYHMQSSTFYFWCLPLYVPASIIIIFSLQSLFMLSIF